MIGIRLPCHIDHQGRLVRHRLASRSNLDQAGQMCPPCQLFSAPINGADKWELGELPRQIGGNFMEMFIGVGFSSGY